MAIPRVSPQHAVALLLVGISLLLHPEQVEMFCHPLIRRTRRLAQVQGVLAQSFTLIAGNAVVDPLLLAAYSLAFSGFAGVAEFPHAASIDGHPRIFIDDLGGDFGTSLLNILGPGDPQDLGDFVIFILELFPERGALSEGDEYYGLHNPVVLFNRWVVGEGRLGNGEFNQPYLPKISA